MTQQSISNPFARNWVTSIGAQGNCASGIISCVLTCNGECSATRYNKGCHDTGCRKINADRQRTYQRERKAADANVVPITLKAQAPKAAKTKHIDTQLIPKTPAPQTDIVADVQQQCEMYEMDPADRSMCHRLALLLADPARANDWPRYIGELHKIYQASKPQRKKKTGNRLAAVRDERPLGTAAEGGAMNDMLIIQREDLVRTAQLCYRIMADATADAETRELARQVNDAVGWTICYDNLLAGGTGFPVEPWGMAWPEYYEIEVVDPFVAALPESVRDMDVCRVLIASARKAAQHVDRQGFSLGFRLENFDVLNETLAQLKRLADEHEGVTT